MKKYHALHETLLRHEQHWLDGLTKLAVCQGMCNPFIKNSHQLMVADIHAFLITIAPPLSFLHVYTA